MPRPEFNYVRDLWHLRNRRRDHRPALDADRPQHSVRRPGVFCKTAFDLLLRSGRDDVQDLAFAFERPAEEDEAVVDETVHEPRVLVPAVLVPQVARPVPRPTPRASDDEEL